MVKVGSMFRLAAVPNLISIIRKQLNVKGREKASFKIGISPGRHTDTDRDSQFVCSGSKTPLNK